MTYTHKRQSGSYDPDTREWTPDPDGGAQYNEIAHAQALRLVGESGLMLGCICPAPIPIPNAPGEFVIVR